MKIKIKSELKNKKETHIFNGLGIKKDNIITYNDDNTITKIIIDNIITIERKNDYNIKINLKEGIKLEGQYMTKYGNVKIETYTKKIKIEENALNITYDLIIDGEYVDTFKYNLEYSIDS